MTRTEARAILKKMVHLVGDIVERYNFLEALGVEGPNAATSRRKGRRDDHKVDRLGGSSPRSDNHRDTGERLMRALRAELRYMDFGRRDPAAMLQKEFYYSVPEGTFSLLLKTCNKI